MSAMIRELKKRPKEKLGDFPCDYLKDYLRKFALVYQNYKRNVKNLRNYKYIMGYVVCDVLLQFEYLYDRPMQL